MEENATELEEGEACYYEDDDNNIDPDIALSYIDEKIQHVLGHFQKDFEGGVSAENLGAKYGGYGSFLPTYERSPTIRSHPKTPQRNYSTTRSPNNLPVEGSSQNLKAPSNAPPSVRLGTASGSAYSLHNCRVPSRDVSVKQDLFLSSAQVVEKIPLKDEVLNKSGNLNDQRTLKVRIKVGSENTVRKNVAIYSGLGLDYSPSSSFGNSSDESGGVPPISQKTSDDSPTTILQFMTSFPVPGGVLISPLHDSLLCLIRKERLLRDRKPLHSLKSSPEQSSLLGDEAVSMQEDGKVLEEKKAKSARKSKRAVELNHGENHDTKFLKMKRLENDIPKGKEFLSNDLKHTPLSNPLCGGADSAKVGGVTSKVFREVDKDVMENRLFSSDSMEEDSLESISGQESGKWVKQHARGSSVEKAWEHIITNSHKDVLVDPWDNGRSKGNRSSTPSKAYSGVSKFKEDLNVGAMAPPKQKVGQKATFDEQDEINMPHCKEKPSFEGKKKSKGTQRKPKSADVSAKESFQVGVDASLRDKKSTSYGVPPFKSKIYKLKSQKDTNKVLGDTNLQRTDNQMDPLERQWQDANHDVEVNRNASLNKSKGSISGKKVDNQSVSGASVKDATNVVPPIVESGLNYEMVPTSVAPVVIEENWVCCDSCQKWRLLPFGTKPEQLPEKWLCSMLNWLPGMNRCDISEADTTKALNALNQLPVSVSQNNLLNQYNGTALGVTLADQHFDRNCHNLSSYAMPVRGKNKHGPKELPNAGSSSGLFQISNSIKNNGQESAKSRSLNDVNQPLAKSKLMKKSGFQHLSKAHNLMVEKHTSKQKEKHMVGGDAKQVKMKSKRESDRYVHGPSKKSKTEDIYLACKLQNFDMVLGKVGLSSSTGFPSKTSGKEMGKHNELGDQAQVLSDGGSVDLRTWDRRNSSVKKGKLKDWQGNQNEIFPSSGHDGKVYTKEESSESGFRKEKKPRTSKTEGKKSRTNDINDRSNKKDRATQIFLSSRRDDPVDGIEEVRNIDKDQQIRKHTRKFASQQALDGVHLLRRDMGSGQISMATTSSSSKVSGSRKTRAGFDNVKGSPVESVSLLRLGSPSQTI